MLQHAKRRAEEPQPMLKNELIVAETQNINNLFLKKVLAIQPPVSLSISLSHSLFAKRNIQMLFIYLVKCLIRGCLTLQ